MNEGLPAKVIWVRFEIINDIPHHRVNSGNWGDVFFRITGAAFAVGNWRGRLGRPFAVVASEPLPLP